MNDDELPIQFAPGHEEAFEQQANEADRDLLYQIAIILAMLVVVLFVVVTS